MKNLHTLALSLAVLVFTAIGCSFSTANLSSLKTSTDKEGKSESTNFKAGDTIFGKAQISNNGGKVKVKLYLVADNATGATKGETMKGSEVSVDIDGDGYASYSLPAEGMSPGSYELHADMLNEAGEKKDSKMTAIKVAGE